MPGQTHPRRLFFALIVAAALVLHWLMAVSVSPRLGVTGDEVVHITGGYSYWAFNDYRLHPENGNFAQRLAALPLQGMNLRFPDANDPDWIASKVNLVGEKFFFQEGNPYSAMLLSARMSIALSAVFVIWLVWRWSRGLFGSKAGWLSLALAVFCPALLAHGGVATSDMVMTACALGSLSAVWLLLHRATWTRLLIASLACGLAFLSKMSGVIIIPIIATLVLLRTLRPAPMILSLFGRPQWIRVRASRFAVSLLLCIVTGIGSLTVLWAGYGFRYKGPNPELAAPSGYYLPWDVVLQKAAVPGPDGSSRLDVLRPNRGSPQRASLDHVIEWINQHRLLPEAYLWGFAQASTFSRYRPAYLMGELRVDGWTEFFPIAFLLKTTPEAIVLIFAGLASLACLSCGRIKPANKTRAWAYRAAPLLVFLLIYGAMALTTNLNIGHRHILPLYPVLYILAGATVLCLGRRPWPWIALILVIGLHSAESLRARPFYLSYFTPVVGGQDQGYRYLVDSSWDWGQGLPDLANWLDRKQADDDDLPVFLNYFGADSPRARALPVVRFGDEAYDRGKRVFPAMLRGGWYVISATNLFQVYMPARGPWTPSHEAIYRDLLARLGGNTPVDETNRSILSECMDLEMLQAARLFRHLIHEEPQEIVGGSLLVYRLTDSEVAAALYGPPPFEELPVATSPYPGKN